MKRTAEQVVSEWRSTGSTDWGQLVSAINYWAITDMCPALRGTTQTDEALRAAVLEEAAKICEARVTDAYRHGNREAEQCAIAIRAAATQRAPDHARILDSAQKLWDEIQADDECCIGHPEGAEYVEEKIVAKIAKWLKERNAKTP